MNIEQFKARAEADKQSLKLCAIVCGIIFALSLILLIIFFARYGT